MFFQLCSVMFFSIQTGIHMFFLFIVVKNYKKKCTTHFQSEKAFLE